VGDIFGAPSIFTIPDYTRAFSWPVAQVQTLLEDLKMAAQGGSEQFLGTFTFAHQANEGEQPRPPEVVDGQQRMVTLFLVLSYLHHWAKVNGLHELRTYLAVCLCHEQGTNSDGTPWVTYRLNFAHQAVSKFFKENLLDNYMPVMFVEAEKVGPGGQHDSNVVPMPNKLMWHLYQVGAHVKRHLDTILQTEAGPLNAERLIVHILSKCFVVAVLCKGKERGPAIFAHLNSTGVPLSSNDCLKAKLLAKLPPVHHPSFLAKWRELEEFLSEPEIRKFLEYVKQLEEFMGTIPQLQDAYQYFSLKIASVDNSKPIIDGIFSHAAVFIQRTKLKRMHDMHDMHAGRNGGMSHMHQAMHLSQPVSNVSHHRPGGLLSSMSMSMASTSHQAGMGGNGMHCVGGGNSNNPSRHGSVSTCLGMDALGSEGFPATAPARLELLANSDILNSMLAQQQGIHAEAYALEGSHHGGERLIVGGSVHGPGDKAHRGSIAEVSQHRAGGSYHGAGGYHAAVGNGGMGSILHRVGGSLHSVGNGSQHGDTLYDNRSQHGSHSALNLLQQSQQQQQQQPGGPIEAGPMSPPLSAHGSADNAHGNPGQLSSNVGEPELNGDDPFTWCQQNNFDSADYFK